MKMTLAYLKFVGTFVLYLAFLFGIPLLACFGLGWLVVKIVPQTWLSEGLVIFGTSIMGTGFWRWWVALFTSED